MDDVIIETSGFGIFSDNEKLALLRRPAKKRGLIILTDSDGAGIEGEYPLVFNRKTRKTGGNRRCKDDGEYLCHKLPK